jgi:hypothetical protein
MFQNRKLREAEAQLAAALEAIEAAEVHRITCEARIVDAETKLTALSQAAVLVALDRKERRLNWTFMRHGNPIVVRTYSTMADDLPTWKRELLGQ